jgi:hypothetical protein
VTILQFRENLADRQAAEAVGARIDWKYLLGLELSDPGFHFSVLIEFRERLIDGKQEALLLEKLLERCREQGWLNAHGQQRTDATHVLASIRVLNRLELVAENLRAAFNDVATLAPEWLQETTAAVHEAQCTAPIQQALIDNELAPSEHLVDAGYVDAELLVRSQTEQGITLFGPTRENPSWHSKVEGAYAIEQFEVDWENQQVRCPQGKCSASWSEPTAGTVNPRITVVFSKHDCDACSALPRCTRSPHCARQIKLLPQPQQEALTAARERFVSAEGKQCYARRADIEGTLSQGVRAFGLRRARYRGLGRVNK